MLAMILPPRARRIIAGSRWVFVVLSTLALLAPMTSVAGAQSTAVPTATTATLPASTPQMRVVPQTPYYPGGPTLDAYLPLDGAATHPALIMVHGGGWQGGDKDTYAPFAVRAATEQHWATFAVNYRLDVDDKAAWADELHDIQAAIRYLVTNASTYGIDPERVILLGGSAGANLVALVSSIGTVNPVTGTAVGAAPSLAVPIRAVALWSPPVDLADLVGREGRAPTECGDDKACDFIWTTPDIVDYLGCQPSACPQIYQQASPVTWASSTTAPSFVANSTDELIPVGQVEAYVAALRHDRVSVEFDQLAGTRHSSAYGDDVWSATAAFLDAHVGGPAGSVGSEATSTRTWLALAGAAGLIVVLVGLSLAMQRRRRPVADQGAP